jgi:DNA-directed RNA polymerase beta' subunit
MELYDEIVNILNGKRGELRSLISGRFNFSSRSVIRQDPTLRIDQVKLPYSCLVIAYEQRIINILMKTYNMTPSKAWDKWYKAITIKDITIYRILEDMIHASGEGLPLIINRNPLIWGPQEVTLVCKPF